MKKLDIAILCLILVTVTYFGTAVLIHFNRPSHVELGKDVVLKEIFEEVNTGRVFEICNSDDKCMKFIPRKDNAVNVMVSR